MKSADGLETLFAVEEAVGEFAEQFGCPPRKVLVGLMQRRALEELAAECETGAAMRLPAPREELIVAGVPIAVGSLDDEVVAVGW